MLEVGKEYLVVDYNILYVVEVIEIGNPDYFRGLYSTYDDKRVTGLWYYDDCKVFTKINDKFFQKLDLTSTPCGV